MAVVHYGTDVVEFVDPLVDVANRFAEDRLFPLALDTDRRRSPDPTILDEMRELGLYGVFSPAELGGAGLDPRSRNLVIEALAGGCLTTTFVWQQHGGAAAGAAAVGHRYAGPLASGSLRGGVAFAHLLRSGPPCLTCEATDDGWVVNGRAPFVTGWGHIDVVHVAARFGQSIIWFLLEAAESASMTASPLNLTVVNGSATVEVEFQNHHVGRDDVTTTVSFDEWLGAYRKGLRVNGSLALGVSSRCLALLGPSPLDQEFLEIRSALDNAQADAMPAARADASVFCLRAASALVASRGGRSMMLSDHSQRLAREAMFLLVQGQTAEIRDHQIAQLMTRTPTPPATK